MTTCQYCGTVFANDDMQFAVHKLRCEALHTIDNNPFASQAEIAMRRAAYDVQLANYQAQISNLQNSLAAKMSSQISGASIMPDMKDLMQEWDPWDPHPNKKEKAKKKLTNWAERYFNGSQE